MKFKVANHIYRPAGNESWSLSHAQVPFAMNHPDGFIRIFYATRDADSASCTAFIDVASDDPSRILHRHDRPVLSRGKPGYFDDSGTMPSWVIPCGDRLRLYYTAWNKSREASYRLSIGVAESEDFGESFTKLYEGPILDRSIHDAIWVGQPAVMQDDGIWKMWYLSCEKIEYIDDHPEPFYNVKYATSVDGIEWRRNGEICIPFQHDRGVDAIGRPFVFRQDSRFMMLHSNRSARGYRSDPEKSYSIACSESRDGIVWTPTSLMIEGLDADWCNVMNEYSSLLVCGDRTYLFFNGNGFGESGFGYAVRV